MDEPREKPILFSGPMVRAILAGRKSVTRRVVKPQPPGLAEGYAWSVESDCGLFSWFAERWHDPVGFDEQGGMETSHWNTLSCPYGQPGDRLWVREVWRVRRGSWCGDLVYRADATTRPLEFAEATEIDAKHFDSTAWRSPIYMPRWASRITLEITEVRVERVQEIADDNAAAIREGFENTPESCAWWKFRETWDALNAKRGFPWEANPWAWRVEFKPMTKGER